MKRERDRPALAVISNALSYRNRTSMDAIERVAAASDVPHITLFGVEGLRPALVSLASAGTNVLAINGGDGTIQAVLTELLMFRPFASLPQIIVLRGGQTNMIAADVGPAGSNVTALARLLTIWGQGAQRLQRIERAVLRVRDEVNSTDQCGMFFGDAAIVETIARCKSRAQAIGLSADIASAFTLADTVIERILKGAESSLFRGHTATVSVDDETLIPRCWTVQLATTLDRLVLGCRPFWGCGDAPVRWMGIRHPAPGLLTMTPRILYGSERRRLPAETCFSRGGRKLIIGSDEPFTIDGEIFTAPTFRTVLITAEDRVSFVSFK